MTAAFRPIGLRYLETADGGRRRVEVGRARLHAFGHVVIGILPFVTMAMFFLRSAKSYGANIGWPTTFLLLGICIWTMARHSGLSRLINSNVFELDCDRVTLQTGALPDGEAMSEPTANVIRFEAARQMWPTRRQRLWHERQPGWTVAMLTEEGRYVFLEFDLVKQPHAEYLASRLTHLLDEVRARSGYRI